MPDREIIVIGTSAGGVEALSTVVAGLPAELPAAVFVVLHVAPNAASVLPSILSRAGRLPAHHPIDGEPIERGRIYVAPPNHHLLMRHGRVCLSRGPRENGHRPAVDPTFRSAAVNHGRGVIGVVLSGALDDGTAGCHAVKRMGGVTVAQNPGEAAFPSMPTSAIEAGVVDHVLYARDIAPMLARLAAEPADGPPVEVPEQMRVEEEIALMDEQALQAHERPGRVAPFSCPDCNGTLFEIHEGRVVRFRCRVGHAFSMETLGSSQAEQLEAALWSAMVALKEKAALARRMVRHMRDRGHDLAANRFEQQAADADQRAAVLQGLLEQGPSPEAGEGDRLSQAG